MLEKKILQRYNDRAKRREDMSESKLATSTLKSGHWKVLEGRQISSICRFSGKAIEVRLTSAKLRAEEPLGTVIAVVLLMMLHALHAD